jgi:5,10-methenyltetrahydrofolate synthetase
MAHGDPSGDQRALPASFRERLRASRLAARLAMPADAHARASAEVERHLQAELAGRPPGIVAFCSAVRGEFDCRPLVVWLLGRGWRACQPVAESPGQPMSFRVWTPDAPMDTDRHGIPIPATVAAAAPDVVLVPLVAFDAQGYRLGYGGGYFDRTLAALSPRPYSIGVGYALARAESVMPQPHDVALDAVATEAGFLEFRRSRR